MASNLSADLAPIIAKVVANYCMDVDVTHSTSYRADTGTYEKTLSECIAECNVPEPLQWIVKRIVGCDSIETIEWMKKYRG